MAFQQPNDKKPWNDRRSSEPVMDRTAPRDMEAEIGVLGSILIWPDAADEVADILRADDFHDDAHRIIFQCMFEMRNTGRKIDPTLLASQLKNQGDFQAIGGAAYLARLATSVPSAVNAKNYAQVVRDLAIRRQLIQTSMDTLREAYDSGDETSRLIGRAEQRVFEILESRGGGSYQQFSEMLSEVVDRLDAIMRGEVVSTGVDTGLTDLDRITGGLHQSELIILAARPSMGKTALAMNIAEHVALKERHPVFFVSLEMSSREMADRMLCSMAKVNGHKLRSYSVSKDDIRRLIEKASLFSDAPLYIDDSPSRTVAEIAAAARRIQRRQGGLGMIVIDYLQLIEPDNQNDPRQEQVAKIARRLKALARELNVPLLCLAQLNRQAEASKDNRPRLSHLRESGAIEQDADVVMFVHREEYYHSGEDKEQYAGQAELILSKQRNGPVGTVELVWQKEYTRFSNAAIHAHADLEQFSVVDDF